MTLYAKIETDGTVRISTLQKTGYKPLKENKPEGYDNLVLLGYTEQEDCILKEYEALEQGESPIGKVKKEMDAMKAQQELTDQALQDLILATMEV